MVTIQAIACQSQAVARVAKKTFQKRRMSGNREVRAVCLVAVLGDMDPNVVYCCQLLEADSEKIFGACVFGIAGVRRGNSGARRL